MTVFQLKQLASTSAHAAADAIRWNYDRAELIADGIIHGIGVFGGVVAATYPLVFAQLQDRVFAMSLLAGVWGVAAVGIAVKLRFPGRFDRLAVGLYLAMGWSGIIAYDAGLSQLPKLVFWLILAGGLLYSFGVIFHAWQRLRF